MRSDLRTGELDRHRLYALLEAMENDLRQLIHDHLRDGGDWTLGSYEKKALENRDRDRDATASGASLVHYLDLGDEIDLLNESASKLDPELRKALRKSTESLKAAVPVRHRVMHFKPLLPDDVERAVLALNIAISNGVPLPLTRRLVALIQSDPGWSPQLPVHASMTHILHNLPLPEHDETGLIGRHGDLRAVKKLLADRRFPVVTILGPGGIGKTALALQALHDISDDPSLELDAILWVSLKTEALTPQGIKTLKQPITDIADIASDLIQPIDDDFDGSLEELSTALTGLKTLVCVDNLETASGDDAIRLIDALPPETQFLFTSRVGIGQLERIVNLGPLEVSAAADLVRRFAHSRDVVALTGLNSDTAKSVASQLNLSPLGIKWFVLSVESGQRPEAILERQEDFLAFCVQNVWSSLEPDAQQVALTIDALEHAVTVQELNLYLDRPADDIRRQLHSLQRHALVRPIAFGGGELAEAFALTDTASRYLATLDRVKSDLEELRRRQQLFLASEERRRLDETRAPLAPQTVRVTNEVDQPAALVLRDALTKSRRRDLASALELIRQAGEMSPGYYEVDRVKGFVLSNSGSTAAATAAFQIAVEKAPTEADRARVSYLLAGHLARQEMDVAAARPHAEFANAVFGSVETEAQLAMFDVYDGKLDAAIASFEALLRRSEGKQQRIIATSLMDAYRRKAEVVQEDFALSADAINLCLRGARTGASFLRTGVGDGRMIEVCVQCIREGVGIVVRAPHLANLHRPAIDLLEIAVDHQTVLQYAPDYPAVVRSAGRIADLDSMVSEELLVAARSLSADRDDLSVNDKGLGKIRDYRSDKGYGFISAGTDELFFHRSAIVPPNFLVFVRRGISAAFRSEDSKKGRSAVAVTLFPGAEPDFSTLLGRRLLISSIRRERNFAFASDEATGVSVFVHQSACVDRRLWGNLTVGDPVVADLQLSGDDRVQAAKASLRRRS